MAQVAPHRVNGLVSRFSFDYADGFLFGKRRHSSPVTYYSLRPELTDIDLRALCLILALVPASRSAYLVFGVNDRSPSRGPGEAILG